MIVTRTRGGTRVEDTTADWRSDTRTFLLDVNVLIALIDPMHTHHARAHDWFASQASVWSTCPLTENAVLRIVGHGRYPEGPGSPAEVVAILSSLCAQPGHQFWADDLSLLDHPAIDHGRLLSHAQLSDTYLLALALHHGGQLATFDARLVSDAVRGGAKGLHLIQ